MKIIKRMSFVLLVCTVMLAFNLNCLGADIIQVQSHNMFDASSNDSQSAAFRAPPGNSSRLKGNSYAEISEIKETESFIGIECSTYAVNEYCNSMYDYLYLTAAYASLSVTFSSGETVFLEDVVVCNGDYYCAVAEISSAAIGEAAENAVVKDFESNHKIYNRLSKYPIEFDDGEAWIETIIFEPYEGVVSRR